MSSPLISVVMPVYNREKYILKTIESLLNQTYRNFELLIVDDGSSDRTKLIIKNIKDPRIVLIEHNKRKGVAAARNTGYSKAKGKYIAISDSDDINSPIRLERQLAYLEERLDVDVVSCWIKEFNENQNRIIKFSSDNNVIRANLIFNPGIPAFMMFRKEKLIKNNCLYHDESFEAAVDYEWYTSLPVDIILSCVPEPLYLYRRHPNQISTNGFQKQQYFANMIRKKELAKIGITPTKEELELHYYLSYASFAPIKKINFNKLLDWCEQLLNGNKSSNYFNQKEFERVVLLKLYSLIEQSEIYDRNLFDLFYSKFGNSNLFPKQTINLNNIISKVSKDEKNVMVFGTKRLGYLMKKELETKGLFIKNFLDNNENIDKKELDGVVIRNPFQIDSTLSSCHIIITVLSESRFDIKETLIKEYNLEASSIFTIEDFLTE